ncbi:TVP38/TMEM64 family inner membrane protein YdjZ [Allorhodopirellula solitaria]|uniref:TVP38/TMEM64 family membrane protein n=1 Tax=Allorhodopirellula solitaria TaxID=2527987 RepID=A0A5C5XY57_9BACT|nr:TVP38/TMEM64 family inner membrane protein YdjZ [Allorhodopirellula solitaria]
METIDDPISSPASDAAGQRTQRRSDPGPNRALSVIRWVSILCILAALLAIIGSLPFDQAMSAAKDWIGGLGYWGPVVLVLLYIVATVLFVPGTILTLVAGAIFGLGLGTVIVSAGSTIGASLAFLIARYAARDKVAAMAKRNRRFGAIDRAIAEGGWKIVGLLRLSPAIPFNVQNYLYGLTPVRFWPYALTSWIAMLPGTFLYVYLGHVTGVAVGADRQRSTAEWAMLAVGLVATVIVTVYVTRLAGRKLNEQVDEPSQSNETSAASQEPAPQSSVRGTLLLAGLAVAAVAAAVFVSLRAEQIERSLTSTFEPPKVAMKKTDAAIPAGPSVDHTALRCEPAIPRQRLTDGIMVSLVILCQSA